MGGVLAIGSRRELFADNFLIDQLEGGARQVLHHPVPREAVFTMDRPWEGCMSGFCTVLQAGDRNRLYYRGWQIDLKETAPLATTRPVTICLAESADGIRWKRKAVNLFDYPGSPKNNIVWMGAGDDLWGTHGFAPFLDGNPECLPEARWKAFGAGWEKSHNGLYLMTSLDGVQWSLSPNKPVLAGFALDSHNTVLWSPAEGCYRAYFRHWDQKAYEGVRLIMTATSPDLVQWSAARPLDYGESPLEPLYTNNVFPYERAPHLRVGFPARYVERPWSPAIEALPELEHRRLRAAKCERYGAAVTDTQFMCSRDGVRFRRWPEAFIRPGLRAEGSWAYGDIYAAWGMLETESDQPGGGRELSFYVTEHYWRGTYTTLRRHTLRLDGFVSVNAPMAGGYLVTRPFTFEGARLSLNFSASAAGSIRVEVQEPDGRPVPGFELDQAWEALGDALDHTVRWKAGSDVSALAGRPVRLRFQIRDADLFSLRFAPIQPGG
jgi:hypothetical protein